MSVNGVDTTCLQNGSQAEFTFVNTNDYNVLVQFTFGGTTGQIAVAAKSSREAVKMLNVQCGPDVVKITKVTPT